MTTRIEDESGPSLFARVFAPHPTVTDPVQRRVATLIALFHIASLPLVPLSIALIKYTKPDETAMNAQTAATVIVCAFVNYALARSPWYKISLYIQVLAAFGVCYWIALQVPTRQSIHFLMVLLPILMAAHLMNDRDLKIVTVGSSLGLASLYFLVSPEAQRYVFGSGFAVIVLILLILLIRYHHGWVESVRREKLSHEYERFQSLMEAAYDTTLTTENGRITQLGRGAVEFFVQASEDMIGETIQSLVAIDDLGKAEFGETTFKRGDGHLGYAAYAVEPISDAETFIALRDVTEAQLKTAQKLQLDRMAQTATLASGIAHEFNTPLMVTMNQLRKADDALDDASHAGELVRAAQVGLSQLSDIVKDLKWFIQPSDDPVCRYPLQVIENAVRLAGHRINHQSEVRVTNQAEHPLAIPDSQLTQLLLNLLFNANEAKPDALERCTIHVRSSISGDVFELSVEDDGVGMSAAVHSRAFQPFFTHGKLAGTGLGLAICHSIVSQVGGSIELQSVEQVGTKAIVRIPLAEAPTTPAEHVHRADSDSGLQIVIDDDQLLSELVAEMLGETRSRHLSSIAAALSLIETSAVDLILCDLNMPNGGAQALYRQLSSARPALAQRMIIMTGGAVDPIAQAFLRDVEVPVLYKPFGHQELMMAVARVHERQREIL